MYDKDLQSRCFKQWHLVIARGTGWELSGEGTSRVRVAGLNSNYDSR